MIRFLLNIFLAVVWCALSKFDGWNFLGGLFVGAVVVSVFSRATSGEPYASKAYRLARFVLYFCKILVQTNLQVAWEVLTPKMHQTPRIIRYPIAGMTDVQRTMLANAITLTPGTLTMDISPDGRWLYLHCMYAKDRDAAVREIDELWSNMRRGIFS
ncbi:MAG: Na+/H+ antiporter subunit E [Phycisphaeraceae bacterium]|nr:Na+/H+ antiporter subunit E [Phycisphaeraceae bacterium]